MLWRTVQRKQPQLFQLSASHSCSQAALHQFCLSKQWSTPVHHQPHLGAELSKKSSGGDTCLRKQKLAYFKFFLQCQEIPTWVVLNFWGSRLPILPGRHAHAMDSYVVLCYLHHLCSCHHFCIILNLVFFLRRKKQLPPILCQGEGNGNPLQYSCLENPMDGGAWWATVGGVAKSQSRLSDFTFTFHFHALEKEMATHSCILAWRIPGTEEPGGLLSMGSHRVGYN